MKMKTTGHEEIRPISQVFEQDDFGPDCGAPKSNHGALGATSRLQQHTEHGTVLQIQ
jgi:hypothetical protein